MKIIEGVFYFFKEYGLKLIKGKAFFILFL